MRNIFVLIALVSGFFMAILDSNIVNIALPGMAKTFHTSIDAISWIANGYNVAFVTCLLMAARLADQFGRKKLYLIGLLGFSISSFMCGVASSFQMLVIFRVLQGISAAIIVPVAMPLGLELVPKEKQGMIGGVMGAFGGLAAAIGPSLGGVLIDKLSWNWVFFINVPVGIFSLIFIFLFIKESYDHTASSKIDWAGMVTSSCALFLLVYALIQVNKATLSPLSISLLFVISIISFMLFIYIEKKSKNPMLPLYLFSYDKFSLSNLALFFVGMGLMNFLFIFAFYLVQVEGMSELKSGMIISTLAIVSIIITAIMTPIAAKRGSSVISSVGVIAFIVVSYLFGHMESSFSAWDYIWRLVIVGFGAGCTLAPLTTTAVLSVPIEKSGIASSISNISRTLGSIVGVAVLVVLLNQQLLNEKEKVNQQAITMIQKSNQTNLEKKQILQAIQSVDKQERVIVESKEGNELYEQMRWKYKHAVIRSFNQTFLIGAFIFLLALICNVVEIYMNRKRGSGAKTI
ncbi:MULTISPECIES: DHA2 family efflux MFS transporter permease subunit [Bacillus]|nr:DHA2 family efflux MFS transporter permease subunit [Bacillus pseudomycoides]MED1599266.1 DHA2 family efflux MFS transporter permease subunit [Bacillus pseudomycoides]OOR46996.1 MFS transporter [Bacillus pseudomycoides]PDX97019.1 MFS transporter [Bacillus pseudomycoides]PEK78031.1 MFS transporter [Bacillus pseudomycoides]PEM98441.1 MFS transporter [Bacillus pseudomycoides]